MLVAKKQALISRSETQRLPGFASLSSYTYM
jgi:hypothetical protein